MKGEIARKIEKRRRRGGEEEKGKKKKKDWKREKRIDPNFWVFFSTYC